jgi:hypothetical protein
MRQITTMSFPFVLAGLLGCSGGADHTAQPLLMA